MRTNIYKIIICIIFLQFLLFVGCKVRPQQENVNKVNLKGTWIVYDLKNGNEKFKNDTFTKEDMPNCLSHKLVISDSGIFVPNDNCFYGEKYLGNPGFLFTKYSVHDSAIYDSYFLKQTGYNRDSIIFVVSKFDVPFSGFTMLSNDTIVIGGDGFLHFLRRINESQSKNDTVKYIYH
jgi:hypothetical protein